MCSLFLLQHPVFVVYINLLKDFIVPVVYDLIVDVAISTTSCESTYQILQFLLYITLILLQWHAES